MTLTLFSIIWAISGLFAYAIAFGYFQRKYPSIAEYGYRADRKFAIIWGMGGVLTLILGFFLSEYLKYGLKWK